MTPGAHTGTRVIPWEYTGLPEGVPLYPPQEEADTYRDLYDNVVVASSTASGKSTVISMYGYKHLMDRRVVLYVGIMKALVEEKRDDWDDPDHPWYELKKAVVTGDFKWTQDQFDKCMEADVILATPEALTARMQVRANKEWLDRIGLAVYDECHLVGAPGRGAQYESCVIQVHTTLPDVPALGLSATIPNVEHFRDWFTALNGKPTHTVVSDFRPVPITQEFCVFSEVGKESESERLEMISEIVAAKPDEQFLVGFWKKSFGRFVIDALKERGVSAEFHNADLDRNSRRRLEKAFREKRIRVLGSTSTLFTGVNLPATNVITTAVTAGIGDIPAYEIRQALGRAGRPRYDVHGYNYIFVPVKERQRHKARILNGEEIQSTFHDPSAILLAFVIEVYMGRVTDFPSFESWYRMSLLDQQVSRSSEELRAFYSEAVRALRTYGCLKEDEAGKLSITSRGKIVAQYQLDPTAFGVMVRNVEQISAMSSRSEIDWVAALCDNPLYESWIGKYEERLVPDVVQNNVGRNCWKAATCARMRMDDEYPPAAFASENYLVWQNVQRYGAGLERLKAETFAFQGLAEKELETAIVRIVKCCTAQRARLYLTQFTVSEQRKLHRLGLYTVQDVQSQPDLARHALSKKRMEEIVGNE